MRPRLHPTPQQWNRLARIVIRGGGLVIVAAVLAILIFIAREALPLFRPAGTQPAPVPAAAVAPAPLAAGVDGARALAFAIGPHETVFFELHGGARLERQEHPFAGAAVTCADYDVRLGSLAVGTSDGQAALADIGFDGTWRDGARHDTPRLRWRGSLALQPAGQPLEKVAADRDEDGNVSFLGTDRAGGLHYARLDSDGIVVAQRALGAALGDNRATSLVVSLRGGFCAAGTRNGTLYLWHLDDPGAPELEDHARVSPVAVTALRTLLGDQTLVVGTAQGNVSAWFRVRYLHAENRGARSVDLDGEPLAPGEARTVLDRDYGRRLGHVPGLRFTTAGRPWTQIRTFDRHSSSVTCIAAAPRGRTFASADASGGVHLSHATSRRTLASPQGGRGRLEALAFAPKGDGLVAIGGDGGLHVWEIRNPHPETSLGTLFGPVWYEGYVEPRHVWQTTGGSDEFEPKLGLLPLLLGTLKGTLYALLFSVPIAVLAALYVSQLASAGLRSVVKPVIELMAAMPSVVVGFLAALWLAPRLENHMGAALGGLLAVPLGLAVAVAAWYLLPRPWRQRARPGTELLFLVPFLFLAAWLGAHAGGPLEGHLFAGDIKQWLFDRHGITFDQRNCIVVGIALGFAVIPIIFTISEDAMGAVPRSLTSAALALGASRWQIGPAHGPAGGEPGHLRRHHAWPRARHRRNDDRSHGDRQHADPGFSPFNGMRTMSAGIAVEIPEAPHGGTLYRVLFLTGFLLFCFTFLLNTGAELVDAG